MNEKTYYIKSECGSLEVQASSIEEAKKIYSEEFDFDFESDVEGSWHWINEDGIRVEDNTENMP